MALVSVRKCDQCHTTIPESGRRISVAIRLTVHNGHERCADVTIPDLCGEECLSLAVVKVVRETTQELPQVEGVDWGHIRPLPKGAGA
jgi:hypothetical protein